MAEVPQLESAGPQTWSSPRRWLVVRQTLPESSRSAPTPILNRLSNGRNGRSSTVVDIPTVCVGWAY